MKFKLDENLDPRLVTLLEEGGHEADTVLSEGLSGQADNVIYEACRASGRALMTLDLDFSNPLRFPPSATEGIVVIRPSLPLLPMIRASLKDALRNMSPDALRGQLWIVEPGRIRVYEPARGIELSAEDKEA